MFQQSSLHPSIAKPPLEPQELFHKDKLEEYQRLRPDLNKETLIADLSKQYDELPEDLKAVYKEKANQMLSDFKSNQDPQAKIPEDELKHTAEVLEEIIESTIKKKVKTDGEPFEPFLEEVFNPTKELSTSNVSITPESSIKTLLIEPGNEFISEQRPSILEKEISPGQKDEIERSEEDKKKETPSSKTHEALSRAGKKGAAKRWGKKYDDLEGESTSSQQPKPKQTKTKPGIDPEISEAFAKIGYLGGKARGGEDKRGSNIDFKTHDALSKAGKMGAAKRWGQHVHGEEVKKPVQSHVQTRSQKNNSQQGSESNRESVASENKEEI